MTFPPPEPATRHTGMSLSAVQWAALALVALTLAAPVLGGQRLQDAPCVRQTSESTVRQWKQCVTVSALFSDALFLADAKRRFCGCVCRRH